MHGEDVQEKKGGHTISNRIYFVEPRTTKRNEVIVTRLAVETDGWEPLQVIGLDGVTRRVNGYQCDEEFAKRVRRDESTMLPSEKSRTYVRYGSGPIREVGDSHFRRPAGRKLARRATALKAAKRADGAPSSDTPF